MSYKSLSRPDLLKWVPDGEFVPNPVGELPYSFDPDLRPRVREYVRKNHSADEIVKRVMPVYESLVRE